MIFTTISRGILLDANHESETAVIPDIIYGYIFFNIPKADRHLSKWHFRSKWLFRSCFGISLYRLYSRFRRWRSLCVISDMVILVILDCFALRLTSLFEKSLQIICTCRLHILATTTSLLATSYHVREWHDAGGRNGHWNFWTLRECFCLV